MSTENSIFKSNLSGIPSEGSREKIGSSLMKPPSYPQQNESQGFDSNVYESKYEESVNEQDRFHSNFK